MTARAFQKKILAWYLAHGRHDLPWRKTRNPYRILVSEVMLQQTQVSRVVPKYSQFLRAFPTIRTLAAAPLSSVLRAWQGLGYNRRALNLKRACQAIREQHQSRVPHYPAVLETLPGIGPGTAGAIAVFAFDRNVAFIETNIRRVYLHFFFRQRKNIHDREVLATIRSTLMPASIRHWYYALMDYGAGALSAMPNPNQRSHHYTRQPKFKGSNRELRGRIIRAIAVYGTLSEDSLRKRARPESRNAIQLQRFRHAVRTLAREGLIRTKQNRISLPRT